MNKPKLWGGGSLNGLWHVTYKIDGVRVLKKDGVALSKSGKPIYNVPDKLPDGDYELYYLDWSNSITLARTQDMEDSTPLECFYSLEPLDERLDAGITFLSPNKDLIQSTMETAVKNGYEGLVLRQGNLWLKAKPTETYDVVVIGLQEGKGRNEGKLGALLTPMGKVGTGFTDALREEYWNETRLVGFTVEVECMSLTPAGKFRHPRFKRVRWDK